MYFLAFHFTASVLIRICRAFVIAETSSSLIVFIHFDSRGWIIELFHFITLIYADTTFSVTFLFWQPQFNMAAADLSPILWNKFKKCCLISVIFVSSVCSLPWLPHQRYWSKTHIDWFDSSTHIEIVQRKHSCLILWETFCRNH